MPDNNGNNGNGGNNGSNGNSGNPTPSTNNSGDILSMLLNNNTTEYKKQNQLLTSIDLTLKKILQNGNGISQSNFSNMRGQSGFNNMGGQGGNNSNNFFGQRYNDRTAGQTRSGNPFGGRGGLNNAFENFADEFERELLNGLLGSDFNSMIRSAFERLANDIGVNVADIPKVLGAELAKKVLGSGIGEDVTKLVRGKAQSVFDHIKDKYQEGVDKYYRSHRNAQRPPQRRSQSDLRDRINGNTNGGGRQGVNTAQSSGAGLSTKEIIIYAESVKVYRKAKKDDSANNNKNNNNNNPNADDNNQNDFNSRLKEILKDKLGEDIFGNIDEASLSQITDLLQGGADARAIESKLLNLLGEEAGAGGLDLAGLSETLVSALGMGGEAGAGAGAGAAAALGGLAAAAEVVVPILLAVAAGFIAIKVITESLTPAMEGFKKLLDSSKKAFNRYNESREKNLQLANERLEADVKTMVETPFKILEDAANKWYDTWDNNLRKINGTQGYNKEELQSLMGAFADRLREENLTSVVSAADITDNLSKVLDSGLSGVVAEEFAFLATKLNAAVPTQDFFSYADTYASIAANSIRMGKSQEEAIADANAQLEAFASNILFASREVAGGFTTGLKDAENIFKQSVQIAQAGKTNNAVEISGVMTAVSAITGAIAPDLATAMTDAIYRAATGGNSSEIVALRSLAGINASNTEFLKQLAANPKEVFSNLFVELAKRQNMSQDAYMEVAEGLSKIFGVSMDAFARVDFAYLAQAISSMDTANSSLEENIELLASGETTTTAEQLKMQQINKTILDEGLAYVLDNEAARAIQQHMWDEQIARELTEATYGVELQGGALEFLEGIRHAIDNILSFLNPFRSLGKLADLAVTGVEGLAQKADIKGLLKAGKVGNGNANALYNLTTRNKDLNLTDDIVTMLGGFSSYEFVSGIRKGISSGLRRLSNITSPQFSTFPYETLISGMNSGAALSVKGHKSFSGDSAYGWGTIGKSVAGALLSASTSKLSGASPFPTISALSSNKSGGILGSESESDASSEESKNKLNAALQSMSDFVKKDTEHEYSYEDWVDSLKGSKYNIDDFDDLLEENGMSEESVRGQFDMLQTQVAAQEKIEREKREEKFWENNTLLLTTTTELITKSNEWLEEIYGQLEEFLTEWKRYYVEHAVYRSGFTGNANGVGYGNLVDKYNTIRAQEKDKSDSAALALAEVLTNNKIDALVDPTLQTNVLLAEILKYVSAILTQSQEGGPSVSLADTIAGLSLGIVNV